MLKPSVEVRDEGGVLVAEFWDCLRLDPAPVQELRKRFETHLRNQGRPDLVVDLNGVGFAGSAALGGFVAVHRLAKQKSGRLIFCNVDPTVKEVLRVSKLDTLFAIVADKPAALALAATPGEKSAETARDTPAPPPAANGDSAPKPRPSNPPLGLRKRKS
jgi:anti-anti-sigma factor